MLESFVIAFSMYSKIPMPRVEWSEKGMRYSMCFFPLVGLVIAGAGIGIFYGLNALCFGQAFVAVALTLLPILLNGGIHMDGFLDTVDAKRSYRSKEEKLEILKDPHAGAFAIIYCGVYLLLTFGVFTEVKESLILTVVCGYVFSRILSGLSVVTFPKAKKEGSLATFADAAKKRVKGILFLELALCAGVTIWISPVLGSACIVSGLLVFWYYYQMSKKLFGGITGDLAGYFLQLCEICWLLTAVGAWKVVEIWF